MYSRNNRDDGTVNIPFNYSGNAFRRKHSDTETKIHSPSSLSVPARRDIPYTKGSVFAESNYGSDEAKGSNEAEEISEDHTETAPMETYGEEPAAKSLSNTNGGAAENLFSSLGKLFGNISNDDLLLLALLLLLSGSDKKNDDISLLLMLLLFIK